VIGLQMHFGVVDAYVAIRNVEVTLTFLDFRGKIGVTALPRRKADLLRPGQRGHARDEKREDKNEPQHLSSQIARKSSHAARPVQKKTE
jgi:hypothetical protein